jgi:hypothetical protein
MNTYHATIGETPQEAWKKTHVEPKDDSILEKNLAICSNLGHAKLLVERAKQAAERNKRRRLKRKNYKKIQVGDIVLIKDDKKVKRIHSTSEKITPLYPWKGKVLEVKKNGTYKVSFISGPDPFPDPSRCYHVKYLRKGEKDENHEQTDEKESIENEFEEQERKRIEEEEHKRKVEERIREEEDRLQNIDEEIKRKEDEERKKELEERKKREEEERKQEERITETDAKKKEESIKNVEGETDDKKETQLAVEDEKVNHIEKQLEEETPKRKYETEIRKRQKNRRRRRRRTITIE